ncbi:hypothetical protein [Paenibacillus sp. 1001270B_150601_E10]|uniref:hypothetical protein n=1 Tax=Paenibacillus sp. 1001270B_150601_E10 TaxID=2787079 RepID=UPI00189F1F8D|nr:hypothetical protein [Paenibacillus sp. 1001270B_150601_E10]
MQETDRMITIFAPNGMGEDFIRQLRGAGLPVAAIVNNLRAGKRMEKLGIKNIWKIRTTNSKALPPEKPLGRIYLFESSFTLTCRLLQLVRPCTSERIVLITRNHYPRSIYRLLGCDMVVYTQSDNVSFLLTDLLQKTISRTEQA